MRYLLVIAGLLVLIGALFAIKFTQISGLISMGKKMEKAGPPPETVSTSLATDQNWEGTVTAVGSIAPVKGVSVSNDAPGVVTRINFESGAMVHEGQVLVELDTSVERTQIASAQARLDLANLTVGRSRALVKSNSIAQSQLDADEAQLKSVTTDIGTINAQIARKIVRAPFSGRLGIRAINIGQYLNPGTPITSLEAIDAVYVDFSLPQQSLANVVVGMPVRVTLEGSKGADGGATTDAPIDGTIKAIDPSIDSTTRTLKVRAAVPNKDEKLRPGMFANVTVVLPDRGKQVTLPATAIVHASYGDSVFVVEDKSPDAGGADTSPSGQPIKIARQQFVRTAEARGDFLAIQDGVKSGQEIVSAGAFKLRNGSPIVIDNKVKPNADLSPRPENR